METENRDIMEILEECALFRGMNAEDIAKVLSAHPGREKRYSAGSMIAQAGEEVRSLHILLEGSVKGEMIDYAGKMIKIEDIHPPRPLAPAFLFGKQNRYPVNITAGEEVRILSIPREGFFLMLRESDKVMVNFINIISTRGQFLSDKINFLSFTTIKGKLARYLLDLASQDASGTIVLPHSQAQLAELFGVARPSIGRAMVELNQEKILDARGRKIEILDQARLISYLK